MDNTGDPQNWVVGVAITPIYVPAAAGIPAPAYAAVGSLPAGIGFDVITRVLSGAPTAVATGSISIRAANSEGTADWTVDYITTAQIILASTIASYRLEVDWEGDGLFAHADADVFPDVRGDINARRGRNFRTELYGRATAGRLTTKLNNDGRKYDRFNVTSPLYGLVLPGRSVRLRMDAGDGVFGTIWGGRLDIPGDVPKRGGSDILEFKAVGVFERLVTEYIRTPMRITIATGAAMEVVLDEVGIPASRRGLIDTGGQVLPRWWDDGFAMTSLESLEETEGGFLYEDKNGFPALQTRNYRIGLARNPTFTLTDLTPGAGQIGAIALPGEDPLEELVNEVRVSYRSGYTVGTSRDPMGAG